MHTCLLFAVWLKEVRSQMNPSTKKCTATSPSVSSMSTKGTGTPLFQERDWENARGGGTSTSSAAYRASRALSRPIGLGLGALSGFTAERYTCTECNTHFPDNLTLLRHIRRVHLNRAKYLNGLHLNQAKLYIFAYI